MYVQLRLSQQAYASNTSLPASHTSSSTPRILLFLLGSSARHSSPIPLLTFVQEISHLAPPHRRTFKDSTPQLLTHAVASIATAEAFNAAPYKQRCFVEMLTRLAWSAAPIAPWLLCLSKGSSSARDGKFITRDVIAVFWASLIATATKCASPRLPSGHPSAPSSPQTQCTHHLTLQNHPLMTHA
jgi:hypothetical protein